MSHVSRSIRRNIGTAREHIRDMRAAAARAMEENAVMSSKSRIAIESSRELMRQTDELMDGPPKRKQITLLKRRSLPKTTHDRKRRLPLRG